MKNYGIIGLGPQGLKIKRLISEQNKNINISTIVKDSKSKISNDELLEKSVDYDGIIISSPAHTHIGYLQALRNYSGKILCEKPPAINKKDYCELLGMDLSRVMFCLNLKYGILGEILDDCISGKYGNLAHVDIKVSHGFAYKNNYKNNWRTDSKCNPTGIGASLLIHFVDLLISKLSKPIRSNIYYTNKSNNSKVPDTVLSNFLFNNGITSSIYCSYANPYESKIDIYLDNSIISYDGSCVEIKGPRDVFDANGCYCSPNTIEKTLITFDNLWNDSFKKMLNNFISVNIENNNFKYDTAISLISNEYILNSDL
jgi:predicted dehydrogenase